ncbi:MAG TPA: DNA polymerase III subunit beta [Phycisphaerae bacterium]|nr:DNA polymerase III subunit beta [Phycisphaerae bacterium]
MHVIVSRTALLEVLNAASTVVASRTTRDILKCVRLTTVNDVLLVCATDLEVGLRGTVRQVEVKSPGDVLVPVDKLGQITRESVDETLLLETEEDKCHIRGADSHFEIYGHDPAEFPPVPDLEGEADFEVDASALQGLIERTVFAVAKESTRYAINGVLWEKHGHKLSLVSTDGRRLAWAGRAVEKAGGEDVQRIVPVKTVAVLQRILANVEGPAMVQLGENQIVVRAGGYVVSSALVEGHFPQYKDVVPKDSDKKIEMNTEELLSGIKRAALLTNEHSKGVRMKFCDGRLVLSSRAPEQGEATISMVAGYEDVPLEIGFNPVFLQEALRVAGMPTITLELKDGSRPGIVRAGEEFLYVIMPVSLT